MKQKKKKSVIPTYGVGLVWISTALAGKLTNLGQVIGCMALSAVVYLVLRLFFPDKLVSESEQEKTDEKTAQMAKQKPEK